MRKQQFPYEETGVTMLGNERFHALGTGVPYKGNEDIRVSYLPKESMTPRSIKKEKAASK